jgi:hypothetical protein
MVILDLSGDRLIRKNVIVAYPEIADQGRQGGF